MHCWWGDLSVAASTTGYYSRSTMLVYVYCGPVTLMSSVIRRAFCICLTVDIEVDAAAEPKRKWVLLTEQKVDVLDIVGLQLSQSWRKLHKKWKLGERKQVQTIGKDHDKIMKMWKGGVQMALIIVTTWMPTAVWKSDPPLRVHLFRTTIFHWKDGWSLITGFTVLTKNL